MSAGACADGPGHAVLAGRCNARLGRRLGVVLIGGAEEPVYLPATAARPAWIRYARDHAASVLHELAHWCLATPPARLRQDYGLVYEPPPRSAAAQQRFYAAEVPVQALEKLFCEAVGLRFQCSDDNPGQELGPQRCDFAARVEADYRALLRHGPGPLAEIVLAALNPHWTLPGRATGIGRCGADPAAPHAAARRCG